MASPQAGDPNVDLAPSASPSAVPASSVSPALSISASTQVRLPPFWAHDPLLWFVQVDNFFHMRHITSETTKYQHLVESLPPSAAAEVRDILLAPAADKPYSVLRDALVKRLMSSQEHRLQQVLSSEELGDRRPTQFLRHLQFLLGDKASSIDPAILKELFLQRLPPHVRVSLAASGALPLSELAELADRDLDIAPRTVAAMPCNTQSDDSVLGQLRQEVARLTELVSHLSQQRFPNRGASPSRRTPSPARRLQFPTRSRRTSPPASTYCWYHHTFRNRARRCQQPCTWPSGNGLGDH
ncbi:uncharacterized protein LOC135398363 [Ornithodoros turicata]|uniref:uncharacterized protein LOC135398363 n=1 Tax=Ornithodoros turicata TaxID=34597 RepID=UPI0031389692